jgi:hypothetical protein
MNQRIRKLVSQHRRPNVRLVEMAFNPGPRTESTAWWRRDVTEYRDPDDVAEDVKRILPSQKLAPRSRP